MQIYPTQIHLVLLLNDCLIFLQVTLIVLLELGRICAQLPTLLPLGKLLPVLICALQLPINNVHAEGANL